MSEITSSKSSKSIFPRPASVSITGISCHITTSYHHCLCHCHLQIPKSSTNVLDFGVQTRTQKHKLEEWGPTMARVDGLSCPFPKTVFPFNTYILQLTTLATCKEHAEVPREWVPKRGKAGQSTSECSREPDMRGTEGLASAWRLRPHGMPMMPYFGWTRLGQGPAGTREKQD